MFGRFLLDPDPSDPKGGAAVSPPEPSQVPQPGAGGQPDLRKAADGLVARHGDPTAALLVLLGENHTYREKNRQLEQRIPGEGSVVLTGNDAKHWGDYRNLGDPSELRKSLESGKVAEAQVGTYRKAEVHHEAAELSGFRPKVLATLARDLVIEIRDEVGKDGKPVEANGKPVRQAVVKGDGDKVTPLKDYAAAHWADFAPSLAAEQATRAAGSPSTHRDRALPGKAPIGAAGNGRGPARRPSF